MTVYSLLNQSFSNSIVDFAKPKSKSLQVEHDMTLATINTVEKIRDKLVQSFIDNGFNINKIDFSPLVREIKDKLWLTWYNGFATGLDSESSFSSNEVNIAEFSVLSDKIRQLQQDIAENEILLKISRGKEAKEYRDLINADKQELESLLSQVTTEDVKDLKVKKTVVKSAGLTDSIQIKQRELKNLIKTKGDKEQIRKLAREIAIETSPELFQKLQDKKEYKLLKRKPQVTQELNRTLNINKYASESSVSDGIDFLTQTDFGRVYLENRLNYISQMYEDQEKDLIRQRLTQNILNSQKSIIKDNSQITESVIQKYFENEFLTFKKSTNITYNNDKKLTNLPKDNIPVSQMRDVSQPRPSLSGAEKKLYNAIKNAMYPNEQQIRDTAQKYLNQYPKDVTEIPVEKNDALIFGYLTKSTFNRKTLEQYAKIKDTDYFAGKIGRVMATEVQAAHHLGRLTSYYNRKVELVRWIPNGRSKSGICERCKLNATKNSPKLPELNYGFSGIYFLNETLTEPSLAIPRHPYCLCILRPLNDKEKNQVLTAGYVGYNEQSFAAIASAIGANSIENQMNLNTSVPNEAKSWWLGAVKNVAIASGAVGMGFMMYWFAKSLTGKQIKQIAKKVGEIETNLKLPVEKSMLIEDLAQNKIKGVPLPKLEDLPKPLEDLRPVIKLEEELTEDYVNIAAQSTVAYKRAIEGYREVLNSPNVTPQILNTYKSELQNAIDYLKTQQQNNIYDDNTLPNFLNDAAKKLESLKPEVDLIQPVQITEENLLRKYDEIVNSIDFGDEDNLDNTLKKLQILSEKTYDNTFTKRDYNNELSKVRKIAKQFTNVEDQFKSVLPEDVTTLDGVDYVNQILNDVGNVDNVFVQKYEKYKQITNEIKVIKNKLSNVREANRYKTKVDPYFPYSTTRLTKNEAIRVAKDKVNQIVKVGKKIDLTERTIGATPNDFNFIDGDQFESIADKTLGILNSNLRNKKLAGYNVNYRNKEYVANLINDFKSYKNGDTILSQQRLEEIRKAILYFTQVHIDDLQTAQFRLSNLIHNIGKKNNGIFVVDFRK